MKLFKKKNISMENDKPKFDYINFVYGGGAAVILVAAMFKFLGWDYANEIFIIGLTTEAIVFSISAFQWKSGGKSYKWENVFPELRKDSKEFNETRFDLNENINQYHKNTDSIIKSVEALEKNMKKMEEVTDELTKSVQRISTYMSRIEDTSESYESELSTLKTKMSKVNEFYDEMSKLVSKE